MDSFFTNSFFFNDFNEFDRFLESKVQQITATVALEADDEILVQRLLERGKTSGRPDDQDEEKIRIALNGLKRQGRMQAVEFAPIEIDNFFNTYTRNQNILIITIQ